MCTYRPYRPLCWPPWGCVTDLLASSSVSGPAFWMCFKPVLWVAASCLDICSSLSPGCTHFTAPGTWDYHISTQLCPLYLDPVELCPTAKGTTNLGVSCGSCISFPMEPFPFPMAFGVSWDMPFSEAVVRWEAVRRKKKSCWDWWTFPYLPVWGLLKWTVLQESGSHIRPYLCVSLELG